MEKLTLRVCDMNSNPALVMVSRIVRFSKGRQGETYMHLENGIIEVQETINTIEARLNMKG